MHNENLHTKKVKGIIIQVGSVYREIMKYLRDHKQDAKLEEDDNISAGILYDVRIYIYNTLYLLYLDNRDSKKCPSR